MEEFDKAKVVLQTAIQFPQFIDPSAETEVIDSHNFPLGPWRELGQFIDTPPGVNKLVVPINIKEYCMMVISEVAPGTVVKRHAHREGIVRYVIKGSLTQNGINYEVGDWVFVPQDVPYEIVSGTGYTAMCLYRTWCQGEPD